MTNRAPQTSEQLNRPEVREPASPITATPETAIAEQLAARAQKGEDPRKTLGWLSEGNSEEVGSPFRERVTSFVEYKRLKVREYLGVLTQEEFDQLLAFDFQEQLQDTPPIEGGLFLPEDELAHIKTLPREQKKAAFTTFKEKLARQREAWAACRVFIERTITFDHDVPREKLAELIEQFRTQYSFSDEQVHIAHQLIDSYYENRQRVLEIRQEYPDDHDLVERLTRIRLGKSEKLDISVGPMSIDIATNNTNTNRLASSSTKSVNTGFKRFGFYAESDDQTPICYTVINTNLLLQIATLDPAQTKTRRHEHEHRKNALFREMFEKDLPQPQLLAYKFERNPSRKQEALQEYFRANRIRALADAKDEITAQLCGESISTLQKKLSHYFLPNGDYDYLKWARERESSNDHLYQQTAQRMLVEEYTVIIQKAVDAYAKLVKKGRYSQQEATALLTDKPLTHWPKTARRLLEQKG